MAAYFAISETVRPSGDPNFLIVCAVVTAVYWVISMISVWRRSEFV